MSITWLKAITGGFLCCYSQEPVHNGWKPGDMCTAWQDRSSMGLVIAVVNEGEDMLVIWSRVPFLRDLFDQTQNNFVMP